MSRTVSIKILPFILGIALLILIFFLNLWLGSVSISIQETLKILFGSEVDSGNSTIILKTRFPSAVAAILAGAGLSIAGLYMQTFFRNPVAGPFILGISSGSALGVALFLMGGAYFSSVLAFSQALKGYSVVIFAGLGAFAVFLLVYLLSLRIRDNIVILIIGLMISSLSGALVQVLQSFTDMRSLQLFTVWTFGGFRDITQSQLMPFGLSVFIGLLILFSLLKKANLLLLGEEQARGFGLNIKQTRGWIMIGTCLLAGSITAFCGPIAFVGLAVPHLCRALFNTEDHRILFPAALIFGAVIALSCNLLSVMPWSDKALPLNAVTSLFGAPAVIWVILRNQRSAGGFR